MITNTSMEACLEPLEPRLLLSATPIDLTQPAPLQEVNGAWIKWVDPQSTGSGVINSFLRVQGSPSERGYNTDGALEFESKPGAFTRSLMLDEVPRVIIDGQSHREFFLDINESKKQELVSLEELEIYLGSTGDLTGYPNFGGDAYKAFDLDEGVDGDVSLQLSYALNSGSGSGDYVFYIPDSALTGPNKYVYLYSHFGRADRGDPYASDAGFEEWSVGTPCMLCTAEIHGYKFNDLNGNGIDDGEPRLSDWTIYLDTNENGTLDAGEPFRVTDESGQYHFDNLVPGLGADSTHLVRQVLQDGWQQTTPNPPAIELQGYQVYVAITGQVPTDPYAQLEVVEPDLAFGNFELITISGTNFYDTNGDGINGPDDYGLEGWTIYLDGTNGRPLNGEFEDGETHTVTNDQGEYSFENLGPGTYTVREVILDNDKWFQTFPPDEGDYTIEAVSGETYDDRDFGNTSTCCGGFTIRGIRFNDLDGDGERDADEFGLAGWKIFLDGSNGGTLNDVWDPEELWTYTVLNGVYMFRVLLVDQTGEPITYTVREVQQDGWIQTTPNPDPVAGIPGERDQVFSGGNFGNFYTGTMMTIEGVKFEDDLLPENWSKLNASL